MTLKKKSSRKIRRSKGKKTSKRHATPKNLWIGPGHLYLPEDENIRKDF